jgi:LysR family nitrogen assimilation transcriptional regulator
MTATVSLCVSDHLPMSEPAIAARSVLIEIVQALIREAPFGLKSAGEAERSQAAP